VGGKTQGGCGGSTVKKKGTPVLWQRPEYSSTDTDVDFTLSSGSPSTGNHFRWNASNKGLSELKTELDFALIKKKGNPFYGW